MKRIFPALLLAFFVVGSPAALAKNEAVCPPGALKVEFDAGVRDVEWPEEATLIRACIKAAGDQFWFDRPSPITTPTQHDVSHVVFYPGSIQHEDPPPTDDPTPDPTPEPTPTSTPAPPVCTSAPCYPPEPGPDPTPSRTPDRDVGDGPDKPIYGGSSQLVHRPPNRRLAETGFGLGHLAFFGALLAGAGAGLLIASVVREREEEL